MPVKLLMVTVPAVTSPSVIVPPPPLPMAALLGMLLFQVVLELELTFHHWFALSQVPSPSGWPVPVPLASQATVGFAATAVETAE